MSLKTQKRARQQPSELLVVVVDSPALEGGDDDNAYWYSSDGQSFGTRGEKVSISLNLCLEVW